MSKNIATEIEGPDFLYKVLDFGERGNIKFICTDDCMIAYAEVVAELIGRVTEIASEEFVDHRMTGDLIIITKTKRNERQRKFRGRIHVIRLKEYGN